MADANNTESAESNPDPGKEAGTPVDITPSRRSSRKKQSTFSDDFEYYTPTGRKKEEDKKPSPQLTAKAKKKPEEQKSGDSEEELEEESVEKTLTKQKGGPKAKVGRGRPKTIAKKTAKKGLTPQKNKKAEQKQKEVSEEESSEEEEEEDDEEEGASDEEDKGKVGVGKKRKAAPLAKRQPGKKGKAVKKQKKIAEKDQDEDESSSDEEDSTPISQLQAQLKQQQAAAKKSPLAQNLVKKLQEVGAQSTSDEDGEEDTTSAPSSGTKRKLEENSEVAPPAKKTVNVSKLGSALASLVKNTPPEDLGLVKRSPSEIAAKMNKHVAVIKSIIKEEDTSSAQKAKSPGIKDSKLVVGGDKIKQEGDIPEKKSGAGAEKKSVKFEKESDASVKSEKVKLKGTDGSAKKVKFEEQKVKDKQGKTVPTKDGKVSVLSLSQKSGKESTLKKESSGKQSQSHKLSESELRQKKIEQIKAKIAEKSAGQRSFLEKHSKSKPSDGAGGKHIKKEGSKEMEISKKKLGETKAKAEVSSKKVSNLASHLAKKKSEVKGHGRSNEEIFKRSILHKKKSHQPFGNKNIVKKPQDKSSSKDSDSGVSNVEKKSERDKVRKSEEGRRKSSDVERRKSKEDKSERRLSHDGSKKRKTSQGEESSSKEVNKDTDAKAPPVLTPASTTKPAKHKHHKPEHEVPIDMSMMDLFKPDGLIVHDPSTSATTSQQSEPAQTPLSTPGTVRPEDVHHVLLEHQYSKTSAAAHISGDNDSGFHASDGYQQKSASVASGRDDVESMSHNSSVIMDASLPEQILEESAEEMVTSTQDESGSKQESLSDRASILETLDTELKESGTDFLIVGQVEVSRQASDATVTSASSASSKKVPQADSEGKGKENAATLPPAAAIPRKRKDSERSSASRKKSTDSQSSAVDKKKDKARDKKDQKKASVKGDGKKKEQAEDDEESGEEDEDFEDDEDDIDWEDPDMLYCLCRKPHNNRFMICCDKCEEWYHGTCVGITRARGKEMEDNEEEYTCPICIKGDGISILEKVPPSSKSSESPSSAPKLLQKCVGRKCSKTPRPGSVYCSNECIMNHAQESLKAIRDEHAKKTTKDKQTTSLESSGKSSSSKPGQSSTSSSSDIVEVMERETGKILRGPNAPTQKGLHRWLEQHPSFEVLQPHKHRSSSKDSRDSKDERSVEKKDRRSSSTSSSSSTKDKKSDKGDDRSHHHHRHHSDHHHKDSSRRQSSGGSSSSSRDHSAKKVESDSRRNSSSSSSSHKVESSSHGSSHRKEEKRSERSSSGGPNQIRINVRTALRDCLHARAKEAEDILLSSAEIKALALEIEEKLFDLFNDTGHKYRAKYRSLIFNIKDQKNKGLFRKILGGKISPDKLVLMSTEDLASRELAKWREQESKHQIEMIEKLEKEKQETKSTNHMTKKTHKGEIEVNDEDLSTLETRLEEKKDTEPDKADEQAQDPAIDTTSQHRAHLFDLNCKVCTGKIVPGPEEQTAPSSVSRPVKTKKPGMVSFALPEEVEEKESKRSSSISSNNTEEKKELEEEDYEKAAEIVKEALEHVHKAEEELSSLPSMVSASPKHHEPALSPPISPKEEPEEVDMDVDEEDEKQMEAVSQPSSAQDSAKTSGLSTSAPSSSPPATAKDKKVVVRSPDSALQSGLEAKAKFTPTSPVLWKGFVSMLDVAKFFTSAYRVSGPVEHISIPDTVHIMGRISPDHMWDYLSKIRQAGSKDITVLRFIPGSDEEKVAYIHLYSYLNSRARCGVANNPSRQVKDFYIVPLASHSKIPRTLLPFDGPGLEENRPHMLIGILVKQRDKHSKDTSVDTSSPHSSTSSSHSHKADKQSTGITGSGDSGSSSSSSSKVRTSLPGASRDPRLAKLAAKTESPKPTPTGNSNSNNSQTILNEAQASSDMEEEYDPEYVPAMGKAKGSSSAPVAAYIPTPTAKKKDKDGKSKTVAENKAGKSKTPSPEDDGDSENKEKHHHHHHHHHQHHHKDRHRHHQHHHKDHHSHKQDKGADEDDSEPYSPSKEAEPYSPGQEAAAEEPYDPEDESLMDEDGRPISSSVTGSASGTTSTTAASASATATTSTNSVSTTGSTTSTASSAQLGEKLTEDSANLSSEELVERMARSNDPSQISSLMVMALSQASTQHEQQQLLVKLTRQVEDRKLQLAEEMQKSSGSVQNNSNASLQPEQKQQSETAPASSSESKEVGNKQGAASEQVPASSVSSTNSEEMNKKESKTDTEKATSSNTSSSSALSSSHAPLADSSSPLVEKTSSTNSSGGIKFTIKPRSKSPLKPVVLGTAFSASQNENLNTPESSTTPTAPESTSLSTTNSQPVNSDRNDPTSRPQLPEALKALMNDVMGGTETPSLEHRTKLLNRKEVEQAGKMGGNGEDKTVADTNEQKDRDENKRNQEMADAALEAQKRSEDEDEARRILESLKNSSSTGSANSNTVKAVEPATKPTKAPSIDELLDRLKKGGFQFPLQKSNETAVQAPSAPSTCALTVTTAESSSVSTPLSSSVSESVDTITTCSPSMLTNPSVPTYTASKPLFSAGTVAPFSSNNSSSGSSSSPLLSSAEDVDLRIGPPPPQKLVAPASSVVPPNSSGTNRPPPRTGGLSPQTLQDRDDRLLYLQQDRDERAFRSGAGPKHPLDPHAFPPLPGMFGSSRMPHSPGPDIPSYQPTPRSVLPPKGRAQPPPPGTEFDKPAEVLGMTDVDLRHPPLPPLPPQPPPPLPPLPHQFREDVDYRNPDPYRPLHHGYNRGRGGHSYHRP